MGEQQDVICPVSRDRDEVGCVCPAAQPAVVSTVPPRNRARAWIGHMVAGSSIVVMVLAPATMETAQRRSRPRVSGRLRRTATTRNAIMVAYGAARHLPARPSAWTDAGAMVSTAVPFRPAFAASILLGTSRSPRAYGASLVIHGLFRCGSQHRFMRGILAVAGWWTAT